MTNPTPRLKLERATLPRSAFEATVHRAWMVGMLLTVWLISLMNRTIWSGYRRANARTDDGSPTVETIGWVTFGFAIVVILGAILRDKLSALADSLPSSLDW